MSAKTGPALRDEFLTALFHKMTGTSDGFESVSISAPGEAAATAADAPPEREPTVQEKRDAEIARLGRRIELLAQAEAAKRAKRAEKQREFDRAVAKAVKGAKKAKKR